MLGSNPPRVLPASIELAFVERGEKLFSVQHADLHISSSTSLKVLWPLGYCSTWYYFGDPQNLQVNKHRLKLLLRWRTCWLFRWSIYVCNEVGLRNMLFLWTFPWNGNTTYSTCVGGDYFQLTMDEFILAGKYVREGLLKLNQLSLCSLEFADRFLWVQNLDLSHNQLRSTHGNSFSFVFQLILYRDCILLLTRPFSNSCNRRFQPSWSFTCFEFICVLPSYRTRGFATTEQLNAESQPDW